MNMPPGEATTCPHCGFNGPSSPECPRCGVVYAKFRKRQGSRTLGSTTDTSGAGGGTGSGPTRITLAPWLIGLLAISAIAIGLDTMREETPAAVEPQPSATVLPTAPELEPGAAPARPTTPAPQRKPAIVPEWAPIETSDAVPVPNSDLQRAVTPSYSWYEGASGFERGIEEAKREGKALAIYFYTDWCPYCRELERELLSRAKVEDFLKYLVKIRVNPESGTRERILANEYGVRGYPSFFIQTAPGARPQKIRRTDGDGLKSPEDFVVTLDQAAR